MIAQKMELRGNFDAKKLRGFGFDIWPRFEGRLLLDRSGQSMQKYQDFIACRHLAAGGYATAMEAEIASERAFFVLPAREGIWHKPQV